jgi:hypothetical protein
MLGGAADTECIFACDESERGDEGFDDGELDDMPFALSQTPTESFLLHKSINSEDNSESPFSKQHQSIIAQHCLAPPVLTGFENVTLDGLKVSECFLSSLTSAHHITCLSCPLILSCPLLSCVHC